MSKASKFEKGKGKFKISQQIQEHASSMTYLTISKLVGWDNGSNCENLFEFSELSSDQINTVFEMFICYKILLPDLNPFQTAIYKATETRHSFITVIDEYLLTNTLEECEARKQYLGLILASRAEKDRLREEARKKAVEEKYSAFEEKLENPLPPEFTPYGYQSTTSTYNPFKEK